jgi:hypothetical protein
MERRSFSMLCASKSNVASKHGVQRITSCFMSIYRAMQQAKGTVRTSPNLNYRYFFITHCPIAVAVTEQCQCRRNRYLGRQRFWLDVNIQKCDVHCTFPLTNLRFARATGESQ